MSYRYQNGDRPLDGFTIQYALGRGGFGEVYFAVSDSGREVALKAVQNYEDVELRGIGHCMNLKSPHLVMIFDVKHAADGTPWVIMEYVSGPSLRDILDEAPNGLDIDQVRFFMRELCKGLSYLHEAGVVHRDLKPHNVFFEDGIVKIGDYSLSKVITNSHRSGNTMTVGSVHYMAPEISMGRYDKTVDIYALGCMLFEMLTGKPPHVGESMGEVLMKHLSQEPDIKALAEPFASAVAKSMQREPADRFATAHEFATAIKEANTPSLMDTFHPATLSLAGQRTREARQQSDTRKQAASAYINQDVPPPIPAAVLEKSEPIRVADSTTPTLRGDTGDLPNQQPTPRPINTTHRKISVWQTIGLQYRPSGRIAAAPDDLSTGWKFLLVIAVAILGTVAFPLVSPSASYASVILRGWLVVAAAGFGAIMGVSDAMTRPGYLYSGISRVGFALFGLCVGGVLADQGIVRRAPWTGDIFIAAMVLSFGLPDWRCLVASDRPRRIVIPATLSIGLFAAVFVVFFLGEPDVATVAGGSVMLFALAMQAAAPFRQSDCEHNDATTEINQVQRPKLAFDGVSILLETIFLGCAVAVTGLIMEGDDDLLAVSVPVGLAGLYALYQRLQRRRHSDGTIPRIGSTVILDLLTLVSGGIFIAMVMQFDDDLLPGLVVFGSLAILFGRLRYLKRQFMKRRLTTTIRSDKLTVLSELVGWLAAGTALSLLPWVDRREYAVGAMAATAVCIVAFRIRFSRNLFANTLNQETN